MQRTSYWKTVSVAIAGGAVCLFAVIWLGLAVPPSAATTVAMVLLSTVATVLGLVITGGFLCLWRDGRISAGKPDAFEISATRVPEPGLLARLGLRFILGSAPRAGDIVRVRPLEEIELTLDANGTLAGLPFMPEMRTFSGRTFRVHRRVDKVNDMRHKTGLRRMRHTVTLTNVRCSGDHHGGCQAECQMLWKDAWLQRLAAGTVPDDAQEGRTTDATPGFLDPHDKIYVCQMTRLWEASQPMSRFDIRQDLRPLLYGNIGIGAYVIALLTRLFNTVQKLRGGIDFPAMPPSGTNRSPTSTSSRIAVGQPVFICRREDIASTLKNSRNKGLWFDRDMVRFCGQPSVLRTHVDRLIHEATGQMVVMKTPCVVLDGVVATGEFLRLCPQHEYIFWREAWLRAAADRADPVTLTTSVQA